MGQKPSIDSIKKCRKFCWTLSLQETDNALGVKKNYCSTFLKSVGLLAQGEYRNQKFDERNSLITFRDLKKGKVKGEDSCFVTKFFAIFLILVCIVTP